MILFVAVSQREVAASLPVTCFRAQITVARRLTYSIVSASDNAASWSARCLLDNRFNQHIQLTFHHYLCVEQVADAATVTLPAGSQAWLRPLRSHTSQQVTTVMLSPARSLPFQQRMQHEYRKLSFVFVVNVRPIFNNLVKASNTNCRIGRRSRYHCLYLFATMRNCRADSVLHRVLALPQQSRHNRPAISAAEHAARSKADSYSSNEPLSHLATIS